MGKCWCLLYTAPDLNRMVFQCTSILKSPESTILCHFDKIQWGGVELFAAIYLSSQWHVLNFINLFFFPPYVCSDRLEYPTGPRRLQVHGSVNLNVAKLWVNSHDFLFTYYFLFYHLPANVHTSFSDSFFNFAALSLCFIYNNSFLPITFLPTLPSALFLFLIPSMPPHLSFSPMFLSNHPLLTPSFFLFFLPFLLSLLLLFLPSHSLCLPPSWTTLTWEKTPSPQCRWPSWSCWAPRHGRTSLMFAISPWPGTTPRLTTMTRRCASWAPTTRRCLTTIIPSSSRWWTAAR